MNKTKFLALFVCVAVLTAPIVEAQAKRLGSGGNVGRVAPSPSAKPQAVPAKPATPAPQAAPKASRRQSQPHPRPRLATCQKQLAWTDRWNCCRPWPSSTGFVFGLW